MILINKKDPFSTQTGQVCINFDVPFFSGYEERHVERIIEEQNPAILCGFNCNLRDNVGIADISIKGFAPFK